MDVNPVTPDTNSVSVENEINLALEKFRGSLKLVEKECSDTISRLLREEDQSKIKNILEKIKSFK